MAKFASYHFENMSFMCRYWETSRAWGHEVFMVQDNYQEVAKARVRYYNRTWEKYTYQSAMYQALENYKKDELAHYIRNKKFELGLAEYDKDFNVVEKPFKSGQKKKIVEEFEQSETGQLIERLRKHIEEGK